MLKTFLIGIMAVWSVSCTSAGHREGDSTGRAAEFASSGDVKAPPAPFYNNEREDVGKIEELLEKTRAVGDVNERVVAIAREFIGTPYKGGTLNIPEEEQLYVNTTGMDCTTFVETVVALAMLEGNGSAGVDGFLRNLQSLRYRDGIIDGYPSRLHYISEWALDNDSRGNLTEITPGCRQAVARVKTIDYMTRNRGLYPALTDKSVFDAIMENEKALKDLHFSVIPSDRVDEAARECLKSGDIVAIVTDKEGLDVSHVGIINIKGGIPYMIHASSKYKKVVEDTVPLREYLYRQKSPGVRVFRIIDRGERQDPVGA